MPDSFRAGYHMLPHNTWYKSHNTMCCDASSQHYKWIVIESEGLSLPWNSLVPISSSKHKLRYFIETWGISDPPLNICSSKMKKFIKTLKVLHISSLLCKMNRFNLGFYSHVNTDQHTDISNILHGSSNMRDCE